MTTGVRILENDGRVQIAASGGQTSLSFDFPIYDQSHIRIIRTRSGVDTTLVITTDYTVPGGSVGVEAGGVVTLNSGATVGDIYTLLLDVPYSRTSDFIVAGDFKAEVLNLELDLITQQNQQIVRDQSFALRLPDSTTLTGATLPAPEASKLIGWDSGATGLSNYALADLSSSVVSSFAQTLLDDASAVAAKVTLDVLPQTNASASTSAYIDFAEDTDNGTNRARVIAPASLAANADITLPGVTGTLATLAGTETLTNKALQDSTTTIVDNSDATKKLAFECSGITTATTRTLTVPNASGTIALTSGVQFSLAYTSSDQTITSAGLLTLAHSLGAAPKLVQFELVCQTAEAGYSIADVTGVRSLTGLNQGLTYTIDATNVVVRYGSDATTFQTLNKTTGAGVSLTNANWKLRVKSWA